MAKKGQASTDSTPASYSPPLNIAQTGSESKYSSLLETAQDLFQINDADGRYLYVNRVWRETLGYTPQEISQLSINDIVHPDSQSEYAEIIRQIVSGSDTGEIETTFVTRDGKEINVRGSITCEFTDDRPAAIYGVFRDISQRKQIEQALRESEEKLRLMFDSVVDGIIVSDLKANLTSVNESAVKLLGLQSKDELLGKSGLDLLPPQDSTLERKQASPAWNTVPEKGSLVTLMKADGTQFSAEVDGDVLRDAIGNPIGFITILRDMSQKISAEAALRESEEKLRLVFDSVIDGIIVTDLNGQIIEVNDGAVRIFGLDNKDQLINENSTTFLKPQDRDEIIMDDQEPIQPAQEYTHLYSLCRADGTEFTAEINGSVIRDASDYAVGFVTVVRDISKRKEAEELYRTLANSSPVGVYIVQDGKCRFVNSQFQKYMGYSEHEMLGMESFELVHPDDRERVRQSAVDMLKGKRLSPYEFMAITKDGQIKWVMETVTSIRYEGRLATLGNFMDITERKKAEKTLEENEKRYRELANFLPQTVFESDQIGNLTFINQHGCHTFGYTTEEISEGLSALQLFVPSDQNRVWEDVFQVLRGESTSSAEYTALHKNGSTFPVIVYSSPITQNNRPVGMRGIIIDNTERKKAEELLQESEERYRNLIESTLNVIFATSVDGKIAFLSPTFETVTGWPRTEWIDQHFTSLTHPEELPVISKVLQDATQGEMVETVETRILNKVGDFLAVEINMTPLRQQGVVTGIFGLLRDITVYKRTELELQEKNKQLDTQNEELQARAAELLEKTIEVERANQLKSEFLANMSHELRTPLNVIIGFAQLLSDGVPGTLNQEQQQCLNDILQSSEHLLLLINDVLDLSKIEAGSVEVDYEEIALTEVLDTITRTMAPILTPKKQLLNIDMVEELPPLNIEKGRLEQVLRNLVDNASKFTPDKGKIRIEAIRQDDMCQISVIDNGTGIQEEDLERIFEPFCQLENPLVRDKRGTGLGLPLVNRLLRVTVGISGWRANSAKEAVSSSPCPSLKPPSNYRQRCPARFLLSKTIRRI